MINLLKAFIIFAIIFIFLKFKKSLCLSMICGIITAMFIFQIPLKIFMNILIDSVFAEETISLLFILVGTTLLQNALKIVDERNPRDISKLFFRKRNTFMFSSFFIGLLPSPTAILMAAPITEKVAEGKLNKRELAFTTNYYRHISEIFLPTYSHIILAIQLSPVSLSQYQFAMIPVVFILFLIPKYKYLSKIPEKKSSKKNYKSKSKLNLFYYYWPIVVLITTILIFDIPVYIVLYPVILLYMIGNRFKLTEYKKVFFTSFQLDLILTTIVIMIFKNTIVYTNIFEYMTKYITHLYLPPIIIFGILFLLGGIMIGSQGMVAIGIPLAYVTFPEGGIGLLVFLMSILFISSLISPTHLCLTISAQYFKVSFLDLIKETIWTAIVFLVIITLYSFILFKFL